MNRNWHLYIGMVILLIMWYFIEVIQLWMVLISIPFLIIPDWDLLLNEKSHRNFLFHSILIWVGIYLYVKITVNIPIISLLTIIITFAVSIHLLLDITLVPSNWKGFYSLKSIGARPFFWFLKNKRGLATTIWLFVNFLASLILLVIEIIIIP